MLGGGPPGNHAREPAEADGGEGRSHRAASLVLDPDAEASLLTRHQQQVYLNLIAKGASPAGACQQLGISPMSVVLTEEQDECFALFLKRVNELLSQNVAAALYRSAMEGSVAAQTFYLKNLPPPEWPADDHRDAHSDPLDDLNDDDLLAQFRQEATRLLAEIEADEARPAMGDTAT